MQKTPWTIQKEIQTLDLDGQAVEAEIWQLTDADGQRVEINDHLPEIVQAINLAYAQANLDRPYPAMVGID